MKQPEHISADRMKEVATVWSAVFMEWESQHMKECAVCVGLFTRLIDESIARTSLEDTDE